MTGPASDTPADTPADTVTGIMGALPEELEALHAELSGVRERGAGGYRVFEGVLEGQRVLLARSGVGKVNAALLSLLLIELGARQIVFTGVAGGVDPALAVGDLVVSRDLVQHDVDATAFGYALGQVPGAPAAWPADAGLRARALAAARDLGEVQVLEGRVASGDQFVADAARVRWLREVFGAACVEMEGAAVAQACARWGVPFVVIRSISDTADAGAVSDFASFSRVAAARAKRVVRGLLARR